MKTSKDELKHSIYDSKHTTCDSKHFICQLDDSKHTFFTAFITTILKLQNTRLESMILCQHNIGEHQAKCRALGASGLELHLLNDGGIMTLRANLVPSGNRSSNGFAKSSVKVDLSCVSF